MTWEDRLLQAAYTSPLGIRTTFDYVEAEESFEQNTSVFRYPGRDGAYVKSLSSGESHFPLDAIISGDNYDIDADIFMLSLKQSGNGILEHPVYGIKTVQVASVKRRDQIVEAGNQAIISIEFLQSIKDTFPTLLLDVVQGIVKLQSVFNISNSESYATNQQYNTQEESLNSQSRWKSIVSIIDNNLSDIASTDTKVYNDFQIISKSITANIATLIDDPLTLASQIIILIKLPDSTQNLSAKLSAYGALIAQLMNNTKLNDITNDSRNSLIENVITLQAALMAYAECTLYAEYLTKAEALTVSNSLQSLLNQVRELIEFQEQKFQIDSLNLLLYGDSVLWGVINGIVQSTSARLVSLAFGLKQERNIILQRPRTIIDLAWELYGTSSEKTLDQLIANNLLEGEEILLIPIGREIVYYA